MRRCVFVRLPELVGPVLNRFGNAILIHNLRHHRHPDRHLLNCSDGKQKHRQHEQELDERLDCLSDF